MEAFVLSVSSTEYTENFLRNLVEFYFSQNSGARRLPKLTVYKFSCYRDIFIYLKGSYDEKVM